MEPTAAPFFQTLDTPLGPLTLAADAGALVRIAFGATAAADRPGPVTRRAAAELAAYFAGERTAFELPTAPQTTPFQARVLEEVAKVPFGATASYGEIARRIGNPGAARAVGLANRSNPLPIVIPCHRIVGAGGRLTGYAGGLDLKRRLLGHERALAPSAADRGLAAGAGRA